MIHSWSKFYYGVDVTTDNLYLSFNEGGSELIAEVTRGKYTPTEALAAVAAAMSDAGSQAYTVTMDRSTRRVTISAAAPFTLMIGTGTTSTSSIFGTLGFSGADVGPVTSATGAGKIGSEYVPQFKLQDWIDPEHYKKAVESTIKKTADGRVEVVTFGVEQYLQAHIRYATNKMVGWDVFRTNATGVADLVSLMDWLTKKYPVELIPDEDLPNVFYTLILERTQESQQGTDYKLRELYDKNLPDFFETGILLFRLIE